MSAGSIIKREGKHGTSYLLKYEAGRDPLTGKRQTRYKTVNGTKKAAEAELRKLLGAVDTGTHVDPSKITVAQWFAIWLDQRRSKIAAKTWERYCEVLRIHVTPSIGELKLQQLRAVHLVSAYNAATLRAGSRHYVSILVKTALKAAIKQTLIARNPCDDIDRSDLPKRAKKPVMRALDQNAVSKLLTGFAGKRLYPLVRTAVGTGMRRGELLALRWNDVDLDKRTVTVSRSLERSKEHGTREKDGGKTDTAVRTIPITPALALFLREHWKGQAETALALGVRLEKNALLFPNAPQTPDVPRNPDLESGSFLRTAKSLGFVGLRLHDLRHTYATLLIAGGANIKAVSQRLGHADITTTLRVYSHVLDSMDQKVSDIAEGAGL